MSAASYIRGSAKGWHNDWVTKVEYFPDLNFMISSSLDGTLKIGELESLVVKKVSRGRGGLPWSAHAVECTRSRVHTQ